MIDWIEARRRITNNPNSHYVIDEGMIYSDANIEDEKDRKLTVLTLPCTEDDWHDWLILNPRIETRAYRKLRPRKNKTRLNIFSEIMSEAFDSFEDTHKYTPTINELWGHIIDHSNPKWGITYKKGITYNKGSITITDDSMDFDAFRKRFRGFF
jgi:hypothetical protein